MSTAKFTPLEAPRETNAPRMGVRESVSNQRTYTPQVPNSESTGTTTPRAKSPVARVSEVLAHYNTPIYSPLAPKRTAGERVSWLDRLNRPSTSRPFTREAPPYQPAPPAHRTAARAPGGPPDGSSSSSTTTIRIPRPPRTPRTPRYQGPTDTPSRDGSRVPEYLRSHRSPTFEPVAPGGNLTPAHTSNRRGAPTPLVTTPGIRRE